MSAPQPPSLAGSGPLHRKQTVNRAVTILYGLYILLCFEVGLLLFFFPWVSLWTKNFFVDHYPWVSALVRNYFVRGTVSGIGLADIWLGIYELWWFRRARSQARSAPPDAGKGT